MCDNEKVPSFGSDFGNAEAEAKAEINRIQEAAEAIAVGGWAGVDPKPDPEPSARGPAERSEDPEKKVERLMDKGSLADIAANATSSDIESDSEYKERGIMEKASWLDIHAWVNRNITRQNFWDYKMGNCRMDSAVVDAVIDFVRSRIFEFCNKGIEGTYDVKPSKKCVGDFGWAVNMLKAGNKVARRGWNGKGMYLWLLKPSTVKREWVKDPMLLEAFGDRDELECLGSIRMFTADKKVLTGWLASQTDILAEDWELVPGSTSSQEG